MAHQCALRRGVAGMRLVVAGLAAALLAACGSSSETVAPPPPPPAPTAVAITPATSRLQVGQSVQLAGAAVDPQGRVATGYTFTWISNGPAVATVDSLGRVVGVSPGTVTITAIGTRGGSSVAGTAVVEVARAPAVRLQIDQTSPTAIVGETIQLTATGFSASGARVVDNSPTWSSSAPSIASVNDAGRVTGLAVGDAVIRARLDGIDAEVTVRVRPVPVASVRIRASAPSLVVGRTLTVTAEPLDALGAPLSGRGVSWNSATPTLATVSTAGVVTALARGPAVIRATIEGVVGELPIEILTNVVRVDVTLSSPTLIQGRSGTATATPRDANGATVGGRTATFATSTPALLSVTAAGAVTALAPGVGTVTAQIDGVVGVATVSVLPIGARLELIAPVSSLLAGRTATYTAVLRDSLDRAITGRSIGWLSTNPAVATVNTSGVVTALTPGITNIVASADGLVANATLTVLPQVARVEIAPDSITLVCCTAQQLRATPRDPQGAPLTDRPVIWSSSAPAVATVSSDGVVASVAPGRAVITASTEGRTGQAVVWVAIEGTSLTITEPPPPATLPGRAIGLRVIATPGFGTVPIAYDGPMTVSVASGDAAALIGTTTVNARGGVALFDNLALRTAGSYRLRVEAPGATSVLTEVITVGTSSFNQMTTGTIGSSVVNSNGEALTRLVIPVTLRTAGGALVTAPTTVQATIGRGTAAIQSGATTVITDGTGSLTLLVAANASFDVDLSAVGFQTVTLTRFPAGSSTSFFVFANRAASDSAVAVGSSVPISLFLSAQGGLPPTLHTLVLEIAWPPEFFSLVSDELLVSSASATVNRSQVAGGTMRIVLTSTTAPLPNTSLFRVLLRAAASSGRAQRVRVTLVEGRGVNGQLLASSIVTEAIIRVR